MRETEFRGKRVDGKGWVYGMPLKSKFNCTYMLTKQGGLNADFIYSRYTILDSKDSIVVKTETIGQFTGLLDKNGNKIFEGDILKSDMYDSQEFTCEFISGSFNGYTYGYLLKNEHFNTSEIIGNIHE